MPGFFSCKIVDMPTQVSFNVADAKYQAVIDAFCTSQGYSALLPDGTPNPETQIQFVKKTLKRILTQPYVDAQVSAALSGVQQAATAAAQGEV